jgi:protease-4
MSAPAKENLTSLVTDLYRHVLSDIVKDRAFKDLPSLLALINQGPYVDEEAVRLKLIDQLGYYDEMITKMQSANNAAYQVIKLGRYFDEVTKARLADIEAEMAESKSFPDHLALIYASGTIISGSEDDQAAHIKSYVSLGGDALFADDIAKAIQKAANNEKVKAIIIRLDSPGGSPSASEAIRHAIMKAKEKGKPVVVSMGGTVASGGYWLASAADHIVAMPTTITGSIGIFGGKIVMGDLAQKLGVTFDGITIGQNAGMWSPRKPFNEFERARFQNSLNHTYRQFITRVAEGRKLESARVMALAEGRIYTGKQAEKLKLVDSLGTLDDALKAAKTLAKLDTKLEMLIKLYPEPKDPFDLIVRMLDRNISVGDVFREEKILSSSPASSPLLLSLAENVGLVALRDSFLPLDNHLLRMPVEIKF